MNLTNQLLMLTTVLLGTGLNPGSLLPCKYSVRDVAFVNVHREPWQLQIIKPKAVTTEQFDLWNAQVEKALSRTNLQYLWVEEGGSESAVIRRNLISNHSGGNNLSALLSSSAGDQIARCSWLVKIRKSERLSHVSFALFLAKSWITIPILNEFDLKANH